MTSLDSQTIARKCPSVLSFWLSRCAFNYSIIFEGAWAPPPIYKAAHFPSALWRGSPSPHGVRPKSRMLRAIPVEGMALLDMPLAIAVLIR